MLNRIILFSNRLGQRKIGLEKTPVRIKQFLDANNNFIDVFVTVDQKLVHFDFNKYSIKSYKKLDDLNKSKILDYSLELS